MLRVIQDGVRLRHAVLDSIQSSLPDRQAVEMMYFRQFRRRPDLSNPQTFTEKIAWRKLYQRDPRFAVFADKIAVKDEINSLLGPEVLARTLWTGTAPEALPLDTLRPPYVIKVNHSSGSPIFVNSSSSVDKAQIVAVLREQLAIEHGGRFCEWGYCGIRKGIIVEEMLRDGRRDIPDDFKFFVYHGTAQFIQVDSGRFTSHCRSYFDTEWKRLPVTVSHPPLTQWASKPGTISEMIQIAERIGKLFDFVRVDLYSLSSRIVFGEATFYPGAGLEPFCPSEWDAVFGAPWVLPEIIVN